MDKPKLPKQIKTLFTSGSAAFIKQALESFKSNDEMVILSALTELCSQLSMANDSVGEDANCSELIKQLIILFDKYPMLPDISLWSLNCINYLLDINPRSTNTVVKYNGVQKIVKLAENVEYIDCVESAIKAIEKMSYENTFSLVEKDAFITVLAFIDFFDFNLRKSALKACLNMSKIGNNIDHVKKHILPAAQNLTSLTKLTGNTEIEKSLIDLAIQCFYHIVSGTRNYNYSVDLNDFCKELTQYGLLSNLFDIFLRFIKVDDEKIESKGNNDNQSNIISSNSTSKNNIMNVNVDTIKTILKLFDLFCTISPDITNFLLEHNTLELIYKVLRKELGQNSHNNEHNDNTVSKSKLSSSSHSLYFEIFGLLISFFPGRNTNCHKKQPLNRIMSPENKNHFLYFSENILTLLIDNILHIPSSSTTLSLVKLISMYCSNSSNEYIKKYIDAKQLANSLSKNLDSKDSSYILEVLILVDLIMQRIPEHFFISFLREGVVENIRALVNVEENKIYVTKDTNINKIKTALPLQLTLSDSDLQSSPESSFKVTGLPLQKPKSMSVSSSNQAICEIIRGNSKLIETKYFTKEKIEELLSKINYEGPNPIEIIEKLEKYKNIIKNNEIEKPENKDLIKKILDLLIKNNITFFEIEKSEIILYLCYYFDENFFSNYLTIKELDTSVQVTLTNQYDKNILWKAQKFFNSFDNQNSLVNFINILQQCISSMNCFKLYFYEYENMKSTTNIFLQAFTGGYSSKYTQKLAIKVSYEKNQTLKQDILKDYKLMDEVFSYYEKNELNKMSVEPTIKFADIREDILKYPEKMRKGGNETDDEYFQEFLKMMLQRDPEGDSGQITINSEQFLQKLIEQKNKREQLKRELKEKAQEKNHLNMPTNPKEISNNNTNTNTNTNIVKNIEDKEKELLDIEGFFMNYDIEFWINLNEGKKYRINNSLTLNDVLKDAKEQMDKSQFLKFCSDFRINFTFIKKGQKQEQFQDSSPTKFSLPTKALSHDELVKFLFDYFYSKNIVNNVALYNIKRSSPFFYLIALIQLCQDNFSDFFKIEQIPFENFENLKMNSLLFKQVRDPYAISTKSIPSWCRTIILSFPFFTNFSTRYLLFKSTAFDTKRSMVNLYIYLRNFLGENLFEDKTINTLSTNIKRIKIKIHRDKIIEDTYAMTSQFDSFTGFLEFEYYNETGTGMGPTLEFYTLFNKEITSLPNIWYKTEDYTLFPIPLIGRTEEEIQKIKKYFICLGYVVARGLYDDRLFDIPLNSLFWDLVLKRPINYSSIKKVDKFVGKFIQDQLSSKEKNDNSLENCDIYFTLPWNENVPLVPGGEDIKLSSSNLEEYVYQVFNKMLVEGQKDIVEAFTIGFNKVFNIKELQCFTSSEIEDIICGSGNTNNNIWTYDNLIQNIIPMHGFTKESLVYKGLINILLNMTNSERKMFLLFVTGSPRLPIGGFKNLYPKLTVVMFQSEVLGSALTESPDSHLPSVMTCQNYLKIPNYSSEEVLKNKLFTAIREGNNAFHLS